MLKRSSAIFSLVCVIRLCAFVRVSGCVCVCMQVYLLLIFHVPFVCLLAPRYIAAATSHVYSSWLPRLM